MTTKKVKTLPVKTALQEVMEIVKAHPIYGLRDAHKTAEERIDYALLFNGGLDLRWDRGWGQDVTMSLDFKVDFSASTSSKGRALGRYQIHIGVGATTRDLTNFRAVLIMYQQVADLATIIQAHLDGLPLLELKRE